MGYKEALEFTLAVEGGWYDGSGSHDPNPTMKGVTQNTYDRYRARKNLPRQSVRLISDEELSDIYRSYWDAVQGDSLPPKTAAGVFDMAVNGGPMTAIKLLQRALGVSPDGVLGKITAQAIAQFPSDSSLAHAFANERLKFYVRISRQTPKLRPNMLTWVDRVTRYVDTFLK